MNDEIGVAAQWWTDQLKRSIGQSVAVFSITTQAGVRVKHSTSKPLSPERVELFRRAFIKELIARYEGHWYPDDVQRGSGYRSISYDSRLDTTLRKAAKGCGIESIEKLIPHARFHVMFVNPGEVKVMNTALMTSEAKTLFSKHTSGPVAPLPRAVSSTTILVAASATGTGAAAAVTATAKPPSKLSPHASPFGGSAKPAGGSPNQSPPSRSPNQSPAPLPAGLSVVAAQSSAVKVVNRSAALLPSSSATTAGGVASTNSPPSAPLSPPLSPPLASAGTGAVGVERRLSMTPPSQPAPAGPGAVSSSVDLPAARPISASNTLTIRSLLTTLVDRVSTSNSASHSAGQSGSSSPSTPPSSDTTPVLSPAHAHSHARSSSGVVVPPAVARVIEETASAVAAAMAARLINGKRYYESNRIQVLTLVVWWVDPIHGYITLEDELIKFVFPGASHNRFEHSIGVSHLAGQMLTHLRDLQPELEISAREILLVKTAGLVHDLGHGPFSHVFDNEFIPRARPNEKWNHEQASIMMLKNVLDENPDLNFTEHEMEFLHELIHPSPNHMPSNHPFAKKRFLYDVVANARNSVDVDKFDYLARDAHATGIKSTFDSARLIKHSKVINNEICFHAKEVYEIFHQRYSMFKRVYSHRVSKAVEYMICDAMLEADPVLKISAAIHDPKAYLRLTDCIVREIENSSDPRLEKARQIIGNIRRRKLYRCVHDTLLEPAAAKKLGDIKESQIAACAPPEAKLTVGDLIVHNLKINYAMKEKNPVDSISFFHEWTDTESRTIPKSKVSSLIPDQFEERYLRVFLRDDTPEKIEAAAAACDRFLRLNGALAPGAQPSPFKKPKQRSASFSLRSSSFSAAPTSSSSAAAAAVPPTAATATATTSRAYHLAPITEQAPTRASSSASALTDSKSRSPAAAPPSSSSGAAAASGRVTTSAFRGSIAYAAPATSQVPTPTRKRLRLSQETAAAAAAATATAAAAAVPVPVLLAKPKGFKTLNYDNRSSSNGSATGGDDLDSKSAAALSPASRTIAAAAAAASAATAAATSPASLVNGAAKQSQPAAATGRRRGRSAAPASATASPSAAAAADSAAGSAVTPTKHVKLSANRGTKRKLSRKTNAAAAAPASKVAVSEDADTDEDVAATE